MLHRSTEEQRRNADGPELHQARRERGVQPPARVHGDDLRTPALATTGLARALIARSFHVLKKQGMTEAAIGVDTENPSGALRLYEGMGFRPVKRNSVYRKLMEE